MERIEYLIHKCTHFFFLEEEVFIKQRRVVPFKQVALVVSSDALLFFWGAARHPEMIEWRGM